MPQPCHGSRLLWAIPTGLAVFLSASFADPPIDTSRLPPSATHTIDFVKEVQPILATACYSCHDHRKQRGDYRLDTRKSALAGQRIVVGNSSQSRLIHYVAGIHPDRKMPPTGTPLTPRQVGILRAWIDQGVAWPASADSTVANDQHWSLRPLAKPALPSVKNTSWVRNAIDSFILHQLEAKGMSPAPPADNETLLRRVTFDLTGLPPSPPERDAFLADQSPLAYEKVVDRLLASPRYGERWARHWMDVIHFAETHGNDQDVPRESAWPYRDYLIRSFNTDKPYARFIGEQIAGDALYPEDPQAVAALGMIAAGPWDESSQQSIRDDTIDKKIAQTLDRDDMITTVMSTFVSATVHCARCHDHKFDPISQADYYGLQAVFAGVDRANRPYDLDPVLARRRNDLLRRKALLQGPRQGWTALLAQPKTQAEILSWEKSSRNDVWTVLNPIRFTSLNGATPSKEADHSIAFLGSRPNKDIYEITAITDLDGITAVRLEVLTDDRLPHRGPGRQDNGNLHLSEFSVQAAPRDNPKSGSPVSLRNAVADFNQDGWDVTRAIDSNPQTAWGIYPQVSKPHQAIFELRDPLKFRGGAHLTFVLEQLHGGGHLIGRVRLSATSAPRPLDLSMIPQALMPILALSAEQRTAAQKEQLALYVLRRQVDSQIAALPAPQMVYAASSSFQPNGSFKPAAGCRPIHILRRGDIKQPGTLANPGALQCVPGLQARFQLADPNDEASRRAALAEWIRDSHNILTWRSIVNRMFHYHFGRGIAATPSDLGRMGARPTHPELLDFLAVHFRDELNGSLQQLHRLMVTSAAYRQSSRNNPDYAKFDADNLLFWRMNSARLDAESVRDAVLAISGKLDLTMGGPSVKQFVQTKGIHVTPNVDYQTFDVDSPAMYRRSVYRFLFRTLPDPLMDALDCPDASQFAPTRATSVTPLQALAMLNDRFLVRQSEHFAARLRKEAPQVQEQIRRAYVLAVGRLPRDEETIALAAYASSHGLANACRVLFNCNEFLFIQ